MMGRKGSAKLDQYKKRAWNCILEVKGWSSSAVRMRRFYNSFLWNIAVHECSVMLIMSMSIFHLYHNYQLRVSNIFWRTCWLSTPLPWCNRGISPFPSAGNLPDKRGCVIQAGPWSIKSGITNATPELPGCYSKPRFGLTSLFIHELYDYARS